MHTNIQCINLPSRHPELVSGSHVDKTAGYIAKQMPKQLLLSEVSDFGQQSINKLLSVLLRQR